VQIIHLKDYLYPGWRLAVTRIATLHRNHADPYFVALDGQVGQLVGSPIFGHRKTEQINVEPNRRVQVSREDLEAEADWHLSTFS
jgi:hypothetical protein